MNERVEMTMEEIEEEYKDEWVLVEVTEDENYRPSKGVVVAHSLNYEDLTHPTHQFHQENPGATSFAFFCGPMIPEGILVVL